MHMAADCDIALIAAHFDPAEALRPGWPLHRRIEELLARAPNTPKLAEPRMIGFGADAQGELPMPLQCDANLAGGGLRATLVFTLLVKIAVPILMGPFRAEGAPTTAVHDEPEARAAAH